MAHHCCYIIDHVKLLVDQMIDSALFSDILKRNFLIPVFKKRNTTQIATLQNLSKIFERVILNRMVTFIEKYNILPNTQYGFRTNYSTKDTVLFLML